MRRSGGDRPTLQINNGAPVYAALSKAERALLIALIHYLKDRHRIDHAQIARLDKSWMPDYLRMKGTKGEEDIYDGVYRVAKDRYADFEPWAREAFTSLYGRPHDPLPLPETEKARPEAFLTDLLKHLVTDPEKIAQIRSAYEGVFALYRFRASNINAGASENDLKEFVRERLEIYTVPEAMPLRFRLTYEGGRFGIQDGTVLEASGFIAPTYSDLYLIGHEQAQSHNLMMVIPRVLVQPKSAIGLVLRRHEPKGFFASRILLQRWEGNTELKTGFVSPDDAPILEGSQHLLRNTVPLDGRTVLLMRE